MEINQPEPFMLIQDLESLKIFADPLRNQIMEIIAPAPLTTNEIAEKLGLPPSKLYYNINLLEKHGFLRITDTTVKGNIIEKHYWLTAYECKLDESLCNFSTPLGQESTLTALAAPVETTREDIIRSLRARAQALGHGAEAHPREVIIFRELRNMTDEQAGVFLARLKEITRDFEAFKSQVDADTHTRALTIAFYPSFYYDQTVSEISADQTG